MTRWEYGSLVAVQTGRNPTPIRVARVNNQLWNNGRIFEDDSNAKSPDEVLNLLGNEGWELVSVTVALDGWEDGTGSEPPQHVGRTFIYHIKRPRG